MSKNLAISGRARESYNNLPGFTMCEWLRDGRVLDCSVSLPTAGHGALGAVEN